MLDSLLFKLISTPDKETVLLAVPEICADKIITLYHTTLFVGHQGVVKTYLTLNDKFYYPRSCTLSEIIRKGMLYLSNHQNRLTTNKAATT